MKKFLSIAVLLALFLNISVSTSFAENKNLSEENIASRVENKIKSEYFQKLYEEQKRINESNSCAQRQYERDAEKDRKELLRLQKKEDERREREEQRNIQMLREEKDRKDREEQLQIQKFKAEEARKRIESANSKIDETFSQIIKANPCMRAAIEDINHAVYSADPDEVKKTIFKLESEKESLKNYKNFNYQVSSDQYENINNRLQAINYELDILNEYQKSNNEYDKKMSELNKKIDEYNYKISECNAKVRENENLLKQERENHNYTIVAINAFYIISMGLVAFFLCR